MSDVQSDEPASDVDGALTRTLGESSDALPLLLSRLSLAEQCHAAEINAAWRDASISSLGTAASLDLSMHAGYVTDDTLAELLSKFPRLKTLNVANCKKISDVGLAKLPQLCPLLVDVNVACLPLITADGVAQAVEGLPKLDALELAGCSGISAADMMSRFGRWLELEEDEDGLTACQG